MNVFHQCFNKWTPRGHLYREWNEIIKSETNTDPTTSLDPKQEVTASFNKFSKLNFLAGCHGNINYSQCRDVMSWEFWEKLLITNRRFYLNVQGYSLNTVSWYSFKMGYLFVQRTITVIKAADSDGEQLSLLLQLKSGTFLKSSHGEGKSNLGVIGISHNWPKDYHIPPHT